MENAVKDRLIYFLNAKKISKTEFGRSIGVSSSFVTSMRKSVQPDKIQSIALCYPELNIEWLLTGAGEMLNNTVQEKKIIPEQENVIYQKLLEEINNILGSLEKIRDGDAGLMELLKLLKSKEQQMERMLNSMESKDKQIDRFLDELAKMRESLQDKDMQIMRAFQLIEAIQKNDYAADERSGAASAAGG